MVVRLDVSLWKGQQSNAEEVYLAFMDQIQHKVVAILAQKIPLWRQNRCKSSYVYNKISFTGVIVS